HWPQMTDEEIRKALRFEVERQVHYKTEEIVFDYYSVLDKSIAETKTRIILVAAKKDLIENYAGLIDAAGYQCGFIEVDTFSLLNCFYINGPKVPADKTIAIINVGMEVTNIDIIKGRIVGLTKDSFVAWSNLVDVLPEDVQLDFNNLTSLKGMLGSDDVYELCLFILNALANQIRRTIEFYESQGRETVEEIYLSGRMAMYKNLDKYMQNILGLKVTIWNPIAGIEYDHAVFDKKGLADDALMLALCAGLSCFRVFSINLLTTKPAAGQSKFQRVVSQYKMIFIVAGVLAFFLIGIWVVLTSQINIKEVNQQKLLGENLKVSEALKDIESLKQGRQLLSEHVDATRMLLSRRVSWSKKLYEIDTAMPKNIWLTEIMVKALPSKASAKSEPANVFSRISAEVEGALAQTKQSPAQVLLIRGTAYAGQNDEMLSAISNFVNNLKTNSSFAADFQKIELKRSYMEMVNDTAVMKFEVECNLW
ncbi:MAG: pilus assembly protein PilM, partial [Candidatus Omnitrophica bacterium]|nr:pilus assembly protein PilM [Candidatus Omnitrophota bacterium]